MYNLLNNRLLYIIVLLSLFSIYQCQSATDSIANSTKLSTTTGLTDLKKQSVCGVNGNTDTICSPKSGEVWKNGTWYPITWNTLYPTYVSSPTLDIYIYFVKNYENILIKKIPSVSTTKGTYPVLVDNTWRLDSEEQTYECLIYLISNGKNPEKELSNRFSEFPPPVHSFVEQLSLVPKSVSLPANTTTSSSSSVSLPTPTEEPIPKTSLSAENLIASSKQSTNQNGHSVQPWVIAIAVLACLAVLGACFAIFWVMRHSRKRKLVYGEKGHLELNSSTSVSMFPALDKPKLNTQTSSFSLNSPTIVTTPTTIVVDNKSARFYNATQAVPSSPTIPDPKIVFQQQYTGFISTPSLQQLSQENGSNKMYLLKNSDETRPHSFTNISSRSEPPLLTSTDALLIADTFRQRMRKPEWQQQSSEQERRQLSDQLLKNELEAEGTLMKKVGKRAHVSATTTSTNLQESEVE